MKLTIERETLLAALSRVTRVVETRNTIPILANVLLEAGEAGLTLRATDLDMEAAQTISSATVAQHGALTVPAHLFCDIVRKLPSQSSVLLEDRHGKGESLTISAGDVKFHLLALPSTDFPVSTDANFTHSFTLPASDLMTLLSRSAFAISTEETHWYLNGIFLHVIPEPFPKLRGPGGLLRSVATDGHRLACVDVTAPSGAVGMPGIIVARKTVAQLAKLLEGEDDDVSVELSERFVRFRIKAVTLTSKTIEGTFPEYGRVIPQDNDKEIVVDRDGMLAAIARVAAIGASTKGVRFKIADGAIVIETNDPDLGRASEELEAEFDTYPIVIVMNHRYLSDIATRMGERMTIIIKDPGSPILFQDKSASYVLMPMRNL